MTTSGAVVGLDGRRRCPWATGDPLLTVYHDEEWGLPVHSEQALYERIMLEAFQAGLSWLLVLRRRPALRAAFADFDPDRVAAFSEADLDRLMDNPAIIRNRAKIRAARSNAQAVIALRAAGGLDALIWSHKPDSTPAPVVEADVLARSEASAALSKALRARGFAFVGPTTAQALMEAIGMIDSHLVDCHRRGASGLFAPASRRPAAP